MTWEKWWVSSATIVGISDFAKIAKPLYDLKSPEETTKDAMDPGTKKGSYAGQLSSNHPVIWNVFYQEILEKLNECSH